MICASCDRLIPMDGVVCAICNAGEPVSAGGPSHHKLALTVRHLKGLVLASLVFGIFVAPFAIYIASRALVEYRETPGGDPAIGRQLVLLRRIAIGLLIFWAFFLGMELATWFQWT